MIKEILISLLCLSATQCFAIDYYRPGDTLWVWASNLNIREKPDPDARVLKQARIGSQVIMLDFPDHNVPCRAEVIRKSTETIGNETIQYPDFELTGYWARISYNGVTGFVFDAYLSALPTFSGDPGQPDKEDFHVSGLRNHAKLIQQTGLNQYDQHDQKFVRYIFDKGYIVQISGGSGHWEKEMLFPGNLSLAEGYLIYLNTIHYNEDKLLEKGADFLTFQIIDGTLTIKKAGSFLVIYEHHSC